MGPSFAGAENPVHSRPLGLHSSALPNTFRKGIFIGNEPGATRY